ncbi:hypothetical protein AGMMS49545_12520 [Betaproteobacteria bacterium]|nr:hypothetical protein AGMMS49545_12520 [Betaproteobacteria bacterium]GHU45873.1 hypothetical protein AGMMS50289_17970 [Betaproteobacteria bacterium]
MTFFPMGELAAPASPSASSSDFSLWRLGFRPFFLGGAIFGGLAVALWVAVLLSALPSAFAAWQPLGGWLGWHRHEMPFGFAAAIIAGFLLTVVQNWTGRPGLHGRPLIVLALLWCSARLVWLAGLSWELAALAEFAFLLGLASVTGYALWKVKQKHNYLAPMTILLLGLADLRAFAGIVARRDDWQLDAAWAAIWLIVALMTMIGGRVIPFFTQQGLARKQAATSSVTRLWLDVALMAGAMAMAVLHAAGDVNTAQMPFAVFFALLAVGHVWRLGRWYDSGIWRVPLIWSLHLACLWLVAGFSGLALFHAGILPSAGFALHALTIGGMGGLILAMMSRVSLAHTGHSLRAPNGMVWAFALINLGAAARVFLAVWHYPAGLALAAICWFLAFTLFVWRYAPLLVRPRADGLPG